MKTKEMERRWAYLELPKVFVQERENRENHRRFYSCSIPPGVKIADSEVGNWKFNAPIVDDPVVDWETMERDPNAKYYSICVPNQPIALKKLEKNETDEWEVIAMTEVDPKDLRKALQENYKDYKRRQEAELEPQKEQRRQADRGTR